MVFCEFSLCDAVSSALKVDSIQAAACGLSPKSSGTYCVCLYYVYDNSLSWAAVILIVIVRDVLVSIVLYSRDNHGWWARRN